MDEPIHSQGSEGVADPPGSNWLKTCGKPPIFGGKDHDDT